MNVDPVGEKKKTSYEYKVMIEWEGGEGTLGIHTDLPNSLHSLLWVSFSVFQGKRA